MVRSARFFGDGDGVDWTWVGYADMTKERACHLADKMSFGEFAFRQ